MPMQTYLFERPAAAERLPAVGTAIAESFGFPVEDAQSWFEYAGVDQICALLGSGAVIGGLVQAPMGQVFGGRVVPTLGVAGVGVVPEARRQGAARFMMTELLRRARREGWALSTLYASTHGLYRSVGYGEAGARHRGRVAPGAVRAPSVALEVRRLTEADRPAAQALYRSTTRRRPGHLDRGRYVWHRIYRAWGGRPSFCTGVFEGETLRGYVIWRHAPVERGRYDLVLLDVVAPDAAVIHRIWQFLADHGTFAQEITGATAPSDPFWLALPHPGPQLSFESYWMLRLIDAPAAIAARGYPPHVRLDLQITVDDPCLPENAGPWRLEISEGEGRLRPAGGAGVRIDASALAGLYAGFLDPVALEARGQLRGEPAALAALGGAFAGRAPWLRDMF